MKQTLGLKLTQGLSLTPALQQAIKLLQMSTVDLQQEIQDALESNLLLEREDEVEAVGEAETAGESSEAEELPAGDPEDYEPDWGENLSRGDVESEQALYEFRQASLTQAPDLKEHLQQQAVLEPFSAPELLAIEHLIDALDRRGFLPEWPELAERVAADCGLPTEAIHRLRQRLQQWDPPGVGAADLKESLLLQLAQTPASTAREHAAMLIREHLALLAQDARGKLLRALDCDEAALDAACRLIRSLNPDPGAAFIRHEDEYVAPDVYVRKHEGRWTASLNPDIAPKLRINQGYQQLIRRAASDPDQRLLKQHLQEARYFLHSLKSRNETLLKVSQEIVDRQRGFLEYGPEAMRPLVLRDIAGPLGIHESTVSRATAQKYMHTPRGLYELKYFFSSAVSTAEGGSCSATAIQAMIRRLIAEELPAKPLSDSRLTQILQQEGIQVARRTVAKYREGMDIAPSHERKRMA